jgi:pyruvate/2-oxoglutarate dehydrogenase complex dihydrolipoamide acyltransferase (E2) component
MPFWYFATIPELPPEVSQANKSVNLVEYKVVEGDQIKLGTPLAIVQNHWARMEIDANGEGFVTKTFFEPGTVVGIGDPFAIVACDGDQVPYGLPYTTIKILAIRRKRGTQQEA